MLNDLVPEHHLHHHSRVGELLLFPHSINSDEDHYTRTYTFLAQIILFIDTNLEKLYQFACLLLRKLPIKRDELPVEIQQTSKGKIILEHSTYEIDPILSKEYYNLVP